MKLYLISLGCDKNLVDSEHMLSILINAGHTIVQDETEAEGVIVNTCCFIGDAKQESINTILELAELKAIGSLKLLVVTGCLAERYAEEIHKEIPEVDVCVGTTSFADIADAISDFTEKKRTADEASILRDPAYPADKFRSINYLPKMSLKRESFSGTPYAYLKIAEGCNKACTYCAIPKMRGAYRSVPMEEILREAKELAESGIKELLLVAQETSCYGIDLYGAKKLPELIHEICRLEGLEWVRVLYVYPEEITEELIATIKNEPKVVKYLDLPIQHASDNILRQMARRTSRKEITRLIKHLRREIPGLVLRTSLIAGFPGETEADFEEMLDFIREIRFDRLGVFTYSREENTVAAKLKNQVPARIKKARRNQAMKLQQGIAFENAAKKVGKKLTVMVEGYMPEDGIYVCRSYMDAPGVDGYVFVEAPEGIMSGSMLEVKVVSAKGYDLVAELRG